MGSPGVGDVTPLFLLNKDRDRDKAVFFSTTSSGINSLEKTQQNSKQFPLLKYVLFDFFRRSFSSFLLFFLFMSNSRRARESVVETPSVSIRFCASWEEEDLRDLVPLRLIPKTLMILVINQ